MAWKRGVVGRSQRTAAQGGAGSPALPPAPALEPEPQRGREPLGSEHRLYPLLHLSQADRNLGSPPTDVRADPRTCGGACSDRVDCICESA